MPPSNSQYLYAAYIATALIYSGYAWSIWWRARQVAHRERQRRGGTQSTGTR